MKRTTLSLAAAVAVLALVVGIATLTRPSSGHAAPAPPRQVPVQRADTVCPQVRATPFASTAYTAFAPTGASAGGQGGATLNALVPEEKPRLTLEAPGRPGLYTTPDAELPATGWVATGPFAPGFAAQETTTISTGPGRGMAGVQCLTPGTDQWFVGTSTAGNRDGYLYLSNNTNVSAQVDVELYGPEGQVQTEGVRSLTFAPGESQNILLKTLKPDLQVAAVHVLARTGRIAAAVRDQQGATGTDWLPQAGAPGRSFVIPGLPEDASNVRLVLYGASETDTEVGIELVGKASTFKPAGFESVQVKRGQVTELDLGDITKGEASAIKLTAARADVLAGVRVTRGTGELTDVAYLAPTPALNGRAVLTDNRVGGTLASLVYLTAPQGAAKVRLSAYAGGEPVTADVDVVPGTTVAVPVPIPQNATQFALTIEAQPGSGPVHAARMVGELNNKVPMFTIQPALAARDSVALPSVGGDLAILVPEEKTAAPKK